MKNASLSLNELDPLGGLGAKLSPPPQAPLEPRPRPGTQGLVWEDPLTGKMQTCLPLTLDLQRASWKEQTLERPAAEPLRQKARADLAVGDKIKLGRRWVSRRPGTVYTVTRLQGNLFWVDDEVERPFSSTESTPDWWEYA